MPSSVARSVSRICSALGTGRPSHAVGRWRSSISRAISSGVLTCDPRARGMGTWRRWASGMAMGHAATGRERRAARRGCRGMARGAGRGVAPCPCPHPCRCTCPCPHPCRCTCPCPRRRAHLRLEISTRLGLALESLVRLGLARREQPHHDALAPSQRRLALLNRKAAPAGWVGMGRCEGGGGKGCDAGGVGGERHGRVRAGRWRGEGARGGPHLSELRSCLKKAWCAPQNERADDSQLVSCMHCSKPLSRSSHHAVAAS